MSALRVLYVGGTGTISWSSVKRSVAVGHEVTVLNRMRSAGTRPLPDGVEVLRADIGDSAEAAGALGDRHFDAVVNFLTFDRGQAERAVELFAGKTSHYLHVSTAALYQKPPRQMPYLESTARCSPTSPYAQGKIAAEDVFTSAYAESGFPATIVRPSHTYDDARPPIAGDWTVFDRLARGEEVVVHGDGTSLWTVTHAEDFAVGLTGLLANSRTYGEVFHVTSDFVYSWNEIYEMVAAAIGVEARLVHVPTDLLRVGAPDWFWSELIEGDLQYSVTFDNSKIRTYVPDFAPRISFADGAARLARWRAEHGAAASGDPALQRIFDRLVQGYHDAEAAFRALAP